MLTINSFLFSLFFLFTGIIFFFLINIIKKDADLTTRLKEYDALQEYTFRIESLYKEIRTFKHDYINLLSTLHIFIEEKQYNQLEEYFQTKILPTGQNLAKEDAILGRLSHIKLLELKGLLYNKIVSALNQNLNVTVDMKQDISFIPVDSPDLIRILGIFLDNAVEASSLSEKRIITIGFLQDSSNTFIRIANSCDQAPDMDHMFELDYSTKSGAHGTGLYNARKIMDRYPPIVLHTSFCDAVFTQELQILS